ncbi:MAG: transcription antitermination factor NusB [Candidatus Glassbacteria bacterium]
MKRRSKSRIWALQIIYTWEIIDGELQEIARDHLSRKLAGEKGKKYTLQLVSKISEELKRIDEVIGEALTSWPIDRLSVIDKNILRIGICELLYFDDIPRAVVIDEAVKLAHAYGGIESSRFINGVLDAVSDTKGNSGCSTL